MTGIKNFKILFVEDVPSDVDLAVIELKKEKLKFDYTTVCTKKDLVDALENFCPDLIISDYSMPVFNGMQALKVAKELFPEIPFILLTGSVNEETAVQCIKAGAIDYVIKEHMTRLPFAVKEALEHALIESEKKRSELLLKESEDRFRTLYNDAVAGLYRTNAKGQILLANNALVRMLGFNSFDELTAINLNKEGVGTTNDRRKFIEKIEREGFIKDLEAIWICRDGREIFVRESAKLIRDFDGKPLYYDGTVEDITEKKKAENELKSSHSILNASLESTADGILIVDVKGKIIKWNQKFAEMWELPEKILNTFSDNEAINHILDKLTDPDKFVAIVSYLYHNPEKSSFDKLEFKDGSIFERFSKPQKIDDAVVGRVWSFRDVTERYATEESLKISEEKFRSIAENLSDIIFITDTNGILTYISPSAGILGYSMDEFLGRFFGDFLVDGELEKAMPLFKNALNRLNLVNTVRLQFKRKDASTFYAELSGSAYFIGNEIKGILGLLRDVSDKIISENELRKLSQAVEQNPASVVITDTSGIIEYVNPKFCEITGYSKEELIGKNPNLLSTKEKSKDDYTALWRAIRSGNDWKGEFHNKKKNGDLYWENATISPIKNQKSEITHFLGIKEDITEKKFMEASVRSSEQRYRELFLNNPVPTYIFDEHTLEFVEVNDAAVHNYGYSREEFANLTLRDLRLPEDLTDLFDSIKDLSNDVFYSHTMRHRKKNGVVFPVEITSHSLPEKNRRRTRLVIAIDITERIKAAEQMKLAKEKAEASDNLKTTFLNNISHEVRTPLNGILGFAEIMSQPELSELDKTESLIMLHESSDRLLNTITNYMDISMLASGNLTVNNKEFLPENELKRLFEIYYEKCSLKKLELFMDIPEKANNIQLYSDPEILRKIISHLLNNAVKFTEKGSIHFGYTTLSNSIEFFVRDTGIGISKESIDAVFDNFVKEDRGPTSLSEGSGLGLSISKGMAELLGGKIRVESEFGKGSAFFFPIPLQPDIKIISSGIPEKEIHRDVRPAKILVAEDDDTNYFYLFTLLNINTKSKILHASTGREAIDLFTANPDIQLILMDIKMPDINGLEATRQIKLLNPHVPIIAVTAHAMSGDEERVLASGCDGYLSKPISKKSLLDKIAEFVNIR